MGQDQVFLTERGVTVSKTRFVVPGQMYTMNGITSVRAVYEDPSRSGPIWTVIVGVIVAIAGFSFQVVVGLIGVAIVVLGVLWFKALKRTFYVVIQTAGGEARALMSQEEAWVDKVVRALHDAIIARG